MTDLKVRAKARHEKPADTAYETLDLLKRRWSPVVYSTDVVDPKQLHQLFEAARWGPSCYNEQPWSFIIAFRGEKAYDTILSCLVAANQSWAKYAPVLGISVARLYFERNQKPNRHAYHDVGLAMGQLLVQAIALDLSVHQMAGFDTEKARILLHIPENHDPVAAFAIGYTADANEGTEEQKKRDEGARARKEQKQFVFEGEWGRAWHE